MRCKRVNLPRYEISTRMRPCCHMTVIVSSPGRDSRDSRSSRLAEAIPYHCATCHRTSACIWCKCANPNLRQCGRRLLKKHWVQTHFALVPVYLSGSFPTFIQYLQNRFFKSLAITKILRPF